MNIRIGKIKKKLITAINLIFVLMFISCAFFTTDKSPGLLFKIKVNRLSDKDLMRIKRIIQENEYILVFDEKKNGQNLIKFVKNFEADEEGHPIGITIGITAEEVDTTGVNKIVKVSVFSLHYGYLEIVKNQIEIITDKLIKEFEKIKGKGNIVVKKYCTGTPLI